MTNQRMLPIEERLSRVEAQASVGAYQDAGLKHLIDSLESQLGYRERLISNLYDEVSDLRRLLMELGRRVRELEQAA